MNEAEIDRRNGLSKDATLAALFPDMIVRDKNVVLGADAVPTNARQCRVRCDGKSVYSSSKFYPGDIIEICPCRKISKMSLYTNDVRDIVFEVVPNQVYVIPLGYCQNYDCINHFHEHSNCKWEWDKDLCSIIIRATTKIPKDTVLVLNIESDIK